VATLERALRDALGQFATGVTVVTVRVDGGVHGATVGSFTSVSLRPPLVLVSLNRASRLCALLPGAPFAVNVLGAHQRDTALHFANRGLPVHPDPRWTPGAALPWLDGAVARFSCEPWGALEAGDHVLYLGRVTQFEAAGGDPLVFHGGALGGLARPAGRGAWVGSLDGPEYGAWAPGGGAAFSPGAA